MERQMSWVLEPKQHPCCVPCGQLQFCGSPSHSSPLCWRGELQLTRKWHFFSTCWSQSYRMIKNIWSHFGSLNFLKWLWFKILNLRCVEDIHIPPHGKFSEWIFYQMKKFQWFTSFIFSMWHFEVEIHPYWEKYVFLFIFKLTKIKITLTEGQNDEVSIKTLANIGVIITSSLQFSFLLSFLPSFPHLFILSPSRHYKAPNLFCTQW
jgi:hypothetical protein